MDVKRAINPEVRTGAIDLSMNPDKKEEKMKRLICITVVLTFGLLILLVPGDLKAEDDQGIETVKHRHRIELFLGGTHEGSNDAFATGLGYEYRLSNLFGVGGFVEHAKKENHVWTFGVPLYAHPYKGFRFLLAPGLEQEESKNHFLMRTGVAYEVEIGRWSITPEFNIDFVEGGHRGLVYGLSFGYAF